jgi:hypothetical protein
MSMRVMTVNVGVNAQCTLFPNGAVHQTASPTDVWLGAGFIEWVELHNNATGAVGGTAVMNLYDAVVNASAVATEIGKFRVGGTTTKDQWRLIASGASVQQTAQNEPYTLLAANAEVTDLRKVCDTIPIILAASTSRVFQIGHHFKGMVVALSGMTTANLTVSIGYYPQQSGWTRRRQFYRPGSTTKVQPATQSVSGL